MVKDLHCPALRRLYITGANAYASNPYRFDPSRIRGSEEYKLGKLLSATYPTIQDLELEHWVRYTELFSVHPHLMPPSSLRKLLLNS